MSAIVTDHSISAILGLDSDRPRKRQRRGRTIFPNATVETLEAAFSDNRYPDIKERLILARLVDEEEARIQVWFQNRRARHRRSNKARQPDVIDRTSPPASTKSPSRLQLLVVEKEQQFLTNLLPVDKVDIHLEDNSYHQHSVWTNLPSLSPIPRPISPLPPTPQPVSTLSPLPLRSVLRLPLRTPRSSFSIDELLDLR